jgi:hypothetical protein
MRPEGLGLLAKILLESGACFKMSELMRFRGLYFGISGFCFFCFDPSTYLVSGFELRYSMIAWFLWEVDFSSFMPLGVFEACLRWITFRISKSF